MCRAVDLFAGIGGFHKGTQEANKEIGLLRRQDLRRDSPDTDERGQHGGHPSGRGDEEGTPHNFKFVWANEWDKFASAIYRRQFPYTPLRTDDINKIDADDIPDHDLLCAGFPCQSFSIAGPGGGFEDTRGTLFREIARIAEHKKPRLLLLENVRGLLSNDEGRTYGTILGVLGSIGYSLEWQMLNSKWFGVPQNRERIFIVGHLRGEPTHPIFPITKICGADTPRTRQGTQTINTIDANYAKGPDNKAQRTFIIDGYNAEYRAECGAVRTNEASSHTGNLLENQEQRIKIMGIDYSNALDSSGYLRVGGHHPENHRGAFTECRIRRLTPLECERLQGFPDHWTRYGDFPERKGRQISDTQRYKTLGNAVTVNVIKFLALKIAEAYPNLFTDTEAKA